MGNNVNLQMNTTVEVGGDEENTGTGVRENRFTSWALWASVLGLAGLILEAAGVFTRLGITDEIWHGVITATGTILSAFGIVNNPTDRSAI